MGADQIEELALIRMSQMQRRAWEFALLMDAGLSKEEANRIADLAAEDRAAAETELQEAA
jgi:hypothetical protein